jgi:hypothetical protein
LLLQELLYSFYGVVRSGPHQCADLFQPLFVSADQIQRALAGERLDAPHARGHSALGVEFEDADFARAVDVGPAAKLRREVADLDDAHYVAVLVAEEGERAFADRLVVARLVDSNFGVEADSLVDSLLDIRQLLVRDRAGVIKVEA